MTNPGRFWNGAFRWNTYAQLSYSQKHFLLLHAASVVPETKRMEGILIRKADGCVCLCFGGSVLANIQLQISDHYNYEKSSIYFSYHFEVIPGVHHIEIVDLVKCLISRAKVALYGKTLIKGFF